MNTTETGLQGVTVVVTRPAAQAAALTQGLIRAGARVLAFPVLEVQPSGRPELARQHLRELAHYQRLIFVSVNAVAGALQLRPAPWPDAPAVAAVGRATAAALRNAGFSRVITPPGQFNTEGLLAMEWLSENALRGRQVLIVRGEGGRETLAESLRQRGAKVDYAEVYRRGCPATDPQPLQQALRDDAVDLITVTSAEAVSNLLQLVGTGERSRLLSLPFLAVSERVAQAVRDAGGRVPPIVAQQPGDDGMIRAIQRWYGEESINRG